MAAHTGREMENGRESSETPSSSFSDLYATGPDTENPPNVGIRAYTAASMSPDSTAALDGHRLMPKEKKPGMLEAQDAALERADIDGGNDDDSSSGMEMSSLSRSASPEPNTLLPAASNKRKLCELPDVSQERSVIEPTKRQRLFPQSGAARLPQECWQQVFLNLSPKMLCKCLRVSKAFNKYLTGHVEALAARKNGGKLRLLDGEYIWAYSRKLHYSSMPRPLCRFSELQMLRLILGAKCQFCDRNPVISPATTLFNAGPGPDGVRVIWPFGVRSCGTCLEERTMKDIEVLSNPHLASLRFGVTHAYRTSDSHFVSESVRQSAGGRPPNIRLQKIYYRPHLEMIQQEEADANSFGTGAVDEWRKGLDAKGKAAMSDSARWEKWEQQMRSNMSPGLTLCQALRGNESLPHVHPEQTRSQTSQIAFQHALPMNGTHPLPRPVYVFPSVPEQSQSTLHRHIPLPARVTRNPNEVEGIRLARRLDIERRCQELTPPLMPNVLQHIESYQAAMQITAPMDDSAWDLLKPRILAQREAAELLEYQRAQRVALLQAAATANSHDIIFSRPTKESDESEYEHAQQPLRAKLGEYADNFINGQWRGGKVLDRENTPIFAANALQYIWKTHVRDQEASHDIKEKPGVGNRYQSITPVPDVFLSLDNMKWVYDSRIKPLADVYRREHFLCAECADLANPKWFGFESLMQHYGAKHTTIFSRGNVVVHWQTAPWPENPPFHQNPEAWTKLERRARDAKGPRSRGTPYNGHSAPYPPPDRTFSSDLTSAMSQLPLANLPSAPVSHQSLQTHCSTYAGHQSILSTAPSSGGSRTRSEKVAKFTGDAHDIWSAMQGISDIAECVRVHTIFHQAATQFYHAFREPLDLGVVAEALTNQVELRPLRNARGLACKQCVAEANPVSANNGEYYTRIRSVKLLSTSSLVSHFKSVHLERQTLDWTIDMIEVPERSTITGLLEAPGMDDEKLSLVAAAFPGTFPVPLPRIDQLSKNKHAATIENLVPERLLDRLGKKNKNQPKRKSSQLQESGHRGETPEQQSGPGEDEYDPRRPLVARSGTQALDPSRFDTDIARHNEPGVKTRDSPAHAHVKLQRTEPEYERRSPSVGIAPPSPLRQKADHTTTQSAPSSAAPDIAAILASLTSQAHTATTVTPPIAFVNSKTPQFSQSLPRDHGFKARYSLNELADHTNPSQQPRHPDQGPPSFTTRDVEELQASLANGARAFQKNAHHPHAPSSSLPLYDTRSHAVAQHVHDGEQRSAQPPPHPSVLPGAPVQYVHLPDRDHASVGYHYERPAPITFIDAYGRPVELIPIDAAPPPVQYLPHSAYDHPVHVRQPEPPGYGGVIPSATAPLAHAYGDRLTSYYELPPGASSSRRHA